MLKSSVHTYRSAYSGLSRSTWLLSLIMLINRSGTMVVPFMTLYLTSIGYSVGQAGFVFGLFGVGAFFGAYFGGRLTDKLGSYPVQLMTLTGGGILFMVLGQMKSYPLICIFTLLLSFVNEAFRPANSTAIANYSNESNRTRSYSLNRLAINLGWAFGSAVGGLLAKWDYESLFWVDGCTNIGAAVLLYFFLKPVKPTVTEKKPEKIVPSLSAYQDKTYLLFIVFTCLFAACFFQSFTNMPVFLKQHLHFSEPFIGLMMAVNGLLIALIEMVMIYKLEQKGRNAFFITIGVAMTGLSFLFLNISGAGAFVAMTMIVVLTFGEMFSMPFMNTYWISRSQPGNRGQYAALYTMAWSAAQTLGPMLGAQLADKFSFTLLWWCVGGVSLISAFALARILRR